ncbi:MAG: hypothetical protein HN368_24055, partial [Spirochaetales bacterium]|nr:hypothetical protein [Spirochaetales bacterium]
MAPIDFEAGNWKVSCLPGDGGRISSLAYAGHQILTPSPSEFRKPSSRLGEYETRPVYGYDDCFPTVDECNFPGESFKCRDHGQLCWSKWHIAKKANQLICIVESDRPRIVFTRVLSFSGDCLTWRFTI